MTTTRTSTLQTDGRTHRQFAMAIRGKNVGAGRVGLLMTSNARYMFSLSLPLFIHCLQAYAPHDLRALDTYTVYSFVAWWCLYVVSRLQMSKVMYKRRV